MKLHSNHKERERYDALADLFAIIKTVEHLGACVLAGRTFRRG